MLGTTLPLPEAPRTPAQVRLGSGASEVLPHDQPGRKRRGPSLATARPPRKQPLICRSPLRLKLGAEENVFLVPHGPTIAPKCPTTVIANKIKHIHFQKESKSIFLPTISVLPLYSQSLQQFQPPATRTEAWQAMPGVSAWIMTTVRLGYSLQFARRSTLFRSVLATTVRSEDAEVLRGEVRHLLEKGAIGIVPPAQSESGFYSRYFLVLKKRQRPATYSRQQTPELHPDEKLVQDDHFTNSRDTRSLWQGIQTITDYKPPPQACD